MIEETSPQSGSVPGMNKDAMATLIDRLEAATIGSKDLGIELLLLLGWHRTVVGHFYGPLYQWSAPDRRPCLISGNEDNLPDPTTSLDAALDLAERVLGDGWWRVEQSHQPLQGEWFSANVTREGWSYGARAAKPALALCIAILRAVRDASTSTCGILREQDELQIPQHSQPHKGGDDA